MYTVKLVWCCGRHVVRRFSCSLNSVLAVMWLWFSKYLECLWSELNVLYNPLLLLQVENVKLLDRYTNRKAASGTLYLTATHLIYVDASAEVRKETWVCVMLGACLNTSFKMLSISYQIWIVPRILKLLEFFIVFGYQMFNRNCPFGREWMQWLSDPIVPGAKWTHLISDLKIDVWSHQTWIYRT